MDVGAGCSEYSKVSKSNNRSYFVYIAPGPAEIGDATDFLGMDLHAHHVNRNGPIIVNAQLADYAVPVAQGVVLEQYPLGEISLISHVFRRRGNPTAGVRGVTLSEKQRLPESGRTQNNRLRTKFNLIGNVTCTKEACTHTYFREGRYERICRLLGCSFTSKLVCIFFPFIVDFTAKVSYKLRTRGKPIENGHFSKGSYFEFYDFVTILS